MDDGPQSLDLVGGMRVMLPGLVKLSTAARSRAASTKSISPLRVTLKLGFFVSEDPMATIFHRHRREAFSPRDR